MNMINMENQGFTWFKWILRTFTFLICLSITSSTLPDFMFGWSVRESRTQAGIPQNKTTSQENSPSGETNVNTTEDFLLKEFLFQGDIKLRLEEAREILDAMTKRKRRRRKRKITANRNKWWQLPIPYMFNEKNHFNATEKGLIRDAMRHWAERTCIRFQEVPANTSMQPVLFFRKMEGCWSYVGKERAFTQQDISIGNDCYQLGVLVHELGHAIGFWHEHSRPDRDDHIRVKYDNIRSGEEVNFLKETWRDIDNLNIPYDVGSIMHYSARAFSSGGVTVETIRSLEQGVLGQRQSLSFYDAKQANLAYCKDICGSSPLQCENEGYPDPNDCSRCRCPDGLTGNTCLGVQKGTGISCGGVIQITGQESYTIQTPGYPSSYPANVECNWLIKTTGDRVVKLAPVQHDFLHSNQYCYNFAGTICDEDYIEIKYRVSLAKTGARFCCGRGPTSVIESQNNTMMVMFKTKHSGAGGFKFIVSSESCGGCMDNTPYDQPACMMQKLVWCPKSWIFKQWVGCPSLFNFGFNCGYYQNRTAYRKGYCLREVGKCCGDFKLENNRCTLPHVVAQASTQPKLTQQSSEPTTGSDVIDTGWSDWSAWSDCSNTCGGCGTRTRTRTCSGKSTKCNSKQEDSQSKACNDNLCPSRRVLCKGKRAYKEQCNIWFSKLCTKYETYMTTCKKECCTGYSNKGGKCVKDPS